MKMNDCCDLCSSAAQPPYGMPQSPAGPQPTPVGQQLPPQMAQTVPNSSAYMPYSPNNYPMAYGINTSPQQPKTQIL